MKKLYNLIFVITLLLITGLITNVDAVSLSNSDGRITVTREVVYVRNPVTNTFTYTVEEDQNNPAAVTGLPSSFNIVFNRTNPVIEEGYWDGTATQTGTLDLTGINFTKVGDYTFYLNEYSSTDSNNYPLDENNGYGIAVSVRNQVDSNNHPTGTLEASVAYIKNQNNTKVSSVLFSSEVTAGMTGTLFITKEVQGNMADADEYFKVFVDIDCPTGDTYPIRYFDFLNDTYDVDRAISYNGSNVNRLPNSQIWDEGTEYEETAYYATYTCGQNNYVYLKHGERAEIYYLLKGTEYSFTEQDATNYETYINGSNNNSKSSGTLLYTGKPFSEGGSDIPMTSNIIGKEIKTKNMANELCTADYCPTIDYGEQIGGNIILNVESSPVPTGVILKYLPYAVLVLVTLGGLTFFVIAKRKTREEN